MPTATKSAAIEQLRDTIDSAAAVFLADFTGLDVEKMTDLRRRCRANGVTLQVVKNTLAIKALRALELSELEPHFRGPTALAVSVDDPTSPARVLTEFRKEHDKPEVKAGFVEGNVITAEQVKALASLPTRDQLISQVMQLALAPAQGFVAALNDIMAKVVRVTDAVRDGMEKGTIPTAGGTKAAPAAVEAAPERPASETTGSGDSGPSDEAEEADS